MSLTGTARRPEPIDIWFCGPYLTATFFAPLKYLARKGRKSG